MIARKTWRETRWLMVASFLIMEVLLFAAVMFWPKIAADLEQRIAFMKLLAPGEFIKRLLSTWGDHGFAAYIATQQFFKSANTVGIATAVLIGTGAIAGERENSTLELLLSRPVSRLRILWSKTWVLALCTAIPIFASTATIPLLEHCIDAEYIKTGTNFGYLMHAAWHSTLFSVAVLVATLCLSSFIKSQVQVAFAIGVIVIIQVGLYFIQVIRNGSAFMLSDHDVYWPILAGNVHFWRFFFGQEIWILAACCLLWAVAYLRFRRMDL